MKSKAAFLSLVIQLLNFVYKSSGYTVHSASNGIEGSSSLEIREKSQLISLYDHSDEVIELTDTNFTASVYGSDQLWFIEFYAHW